MQDPRSRKDWMLDILDQVMPAETPAQLLWHGKYGEASAVLAFQIWQRTEGRKFKSPHSSGQSPDKYAFYAFLRGVSLLLGSEEVESDFQDGLLKVQQTFLNTADRTLTTVELLGYVAWALAYKRECVNLVIYGERNDLPCTTQASDADLTASYFLESLLTEEDFELSRAVRWHPR